MKTMLSLLLPPRGLALFSAVGFLALTAAQSRAVSLYNVSLNTTAFSGQNGVVAFDFIGGDGLAANNTVTISNLASNGLLGSTAPFSITDTLFFNEVLRNITFGTSLSFTLTLTENNTAPGADQFSLFFLDALTFQPLFGTTDPTGASALFAIDITGAPGGSSSSFAPVIPNVSWDVGYVPPTSGVPDGGSGLWLMLGGIAGIVVARRSLVRSA